MTHDIDERKRWLALIRYDTSTNPFNDELATGLAVLAARFERV